MNLLLSSPLATVEFASLSLLLKDETTFGSGEALIVPSPLTTLSASACQACLNELHTYLRPVILKFGMKSSENNNNNNNNHANNSNSLVSQQQQQQRNNLSVADQLCVDDATLSDDQCIQIFRSTQNGIGLYFLITRDPKVLQPSFAALLNHKHNSSSSISHSTSQLLQGALLTVAVSGRHMFLTGNTSTLPRRMQDTASLIRHKLKPTSDPESLKTAIRALLSTMCLTEDEERRTNRMVEREQVTLMMDVETEDDGGFRDGTRSTGPNIRLGLRNRGENSRDGGSGRLGSMRRGFSGGSDVMKLSLELDNSADMARTISDRIAVLSVAEKDSQLRGFATPGSQRRAATESLVTKKRVRSKRKSAGAEEADLKDFGFDRQQKKIAAAATASNAGTGGDGTNGNQSSSGATASLVTPSGGLRAHPKDTTTRRDSKVSLASSSGIGAASGTGSSGIAPLAKSSKDRSSTQQTRKRSMLGNMSSMSSSHQINPSSSQLTQAFDVFADVGEGGMGSGGTGQNYQNSFGHIAFPDFGSTSFGATSSATASTATTATATASATTAASSSFGASPAAASAAAMDAFPSSPDPVLPAPAPAASSSFQTQKSSSSGFGSSNAGESMNTFQMSGFTSNTNNTSSSSGTEYTSESTVRHSEAMRDDLSSTTRARIQVNVALNEDLTCSYRNSRISSCQIEGVVQVQVRSELSTSGTPFLLLLRDPSRHIRAIQENKRYADDVAELLPGSSVAASVEDEEGIDFKYSIKVPRAENYFPVMRYKCATDLRPVPIRVQTRTRLSGGYCRVALQISSNPANEDNLTDLTIIMGVPQEVRGESLTTVPPGGVWNEQRRSVIWCVAELGSGEKFQLQATFEMSSSAAAAANAGGEKPKFPVLVRCQCMYAQLSDVELEVADIPEIFPADVTMKLARRFRLSHRERS